MSNSRTKLDEILDSSSASELADSLRAAGMSLNVPQANKICSRLAELEPSPEALRISIVHTYTSDLLAPWLSLEAALQGFAPEVFHAPYGLCLQEARAGSDLVCSNPDVTLFMLQKEDLHPALGAEFSSLDGDQRQQVFEQALDSLASIVRAFREQLPGQFVVTLLPEVLAPGAGVYDSQSERSQAAWWGRFKEAVGSCFRDSFEATLFVDLDELLMDVGRQQFFDLRFWYSARFPFTPASARGLCRQLVSIGSLGKRPRAKVIVLDADNTLWGGVIGEDGMTGIALGPDYPGNTFVDFQKRLLQYQQRGFLLAMCSKNNLADVDQVLREHPHQLLREEHFAARRVNWEPKPDNLIALARELNLGVDSLVFVDDSDYECASVRHRLPEVEVVQVPPRPVDVPGCLDHLARLEVLSLTAEDLQKTAMYKQQRQRQELLESAGDSSQGFDDYLESLEMQMTVAVDDSSQLPRLTQLTQKTNQYNLTTRRYSETEMKACIDSDDWRVLHFSLRDRFGDSGVVGLAILDLSGAEQPYLDTFLMSCRVIGRRAEEAFIDQIYRQLLAQGYNRLSAQYLPTAKNAPVSEFLEQQGFQPCGDGPVYKDLSELADAKAIDFPMTVHCD